MLKQDLSIIVSGFLSIPVAAETTAITGGTIFTTPNSPPIQSGLIVISKGEIVDVGATGKVVIPDNARIIDATGKFITAGFWNSHVHYTGALEHAAAEPAEDLQRQLTNFFLQWGFVNTVDTGSFLMKTLTIRSRIEAGEVDGPKIITMSGSFVPEGGNPFYVEPIQLPEFLDETMIPSMIGSVLKQGADGIKIFSGSWATPENVVVMMPAHVKATTDAAHRQGAMVIAHPSDSDGARIAVENGVDILAHTFPAEIKGPWDKSLPKKMAARNMALIPTLKLFRIELAKAGLPDRVVDRIESIAVEQTASAHQAGVQILFGTDVGYMEDSDTSAEFTLMERAGLDYRAILAALTTEPTQRFGFSDREGKIAPGHNADLVILGSDPRQATSAFSDVRAVFRGGKIVFERD